MHHELLGLNHAEKYDGDAHKTGIESCSDIFAQ